MKIRTASQAVIRYKLTNQDMTTHNGYQWELGKVNETLGGGELCGPGWLHCYNDPVIAVLLNPIHAAIVTPRIFKVKCYGMCKTDRGLKEGWTKMGLVSEILLPKLDLIQKTGFAILCAKEVYTEKSWNEWADNWLSNKDRGSTAANAADAAANAAYAADAAYYAANAADAAANAAYAADAAYYAANYADYAAAYAAVYAAKQLNLVKISRQALKIK